ncbi:hypothetical protein KEM55_001398, partial [Ascosphaera atra]
MTRPQSQEDMALSQPVAKVLWTPQRPEETEMYKFKTLVCERHGLDLPGYHELWAWSVSKPEPFWKEVFEYTGVRVHRSYDKVLERTTPLYPKPTFFTNSTLNFAENLLYPASSPAPDSVAILAATESGRQTLT